MKTANKSRLAKASRFLAFLMIFGIAAGCSSSNDPQPEPKPEEVEEPETPEHVFNQLQTIENLFTPAGDKVPPTLFSLEQGTIIENKYAQTRLWDISFSDLYASFVDANNKKDGYGKDGLGSGGILMINKDFDEVIDIPKDNEFRTGGTPYGPDKSGAVSDVDGWFLYDMYGEIKGDKDPDKKHVCYPLEDRTLVVRTARGNYAKIRIKSVYKNDLDPANWSVKSEKTYYTFDYVLAKKGSTKFEIKASEE